MSDEESDNAGWEEWVASVPGPVDDVVAEIRRTAADGKLGDGELRARWRPVVEASGALLADLARLGQFVWDADRDFEVAVALEDLNRRFVDVIASFPDIATLYDDVDRLDGWLRRQVEQTGADSPIWAYLSWVEAFLDGVIRRIVDRVFDEEGTELSPEQAADFLERLDAVLERLLEKWTRDLEFRPGKPRGSRGASGANTGENEPSGGGPRRDR